MTHLVETITVRSGADPAAPHLGTLRIGTWEVPCVTGKGGLATPGRKREGDMCTPIGTFPLRYGFYDPAVFGDAPRGFAFPFVEKPAGWFWVEDCDDPLYNRLACDPAGRPARTNESLFDLFVPVGWNDATPVTGKGSGILIHGARPDFSGTAGCVAVAPDHLLELARRLRPGMLIDIGPAGDAGAEIPRPPARAEEAPESVTFRALHPGPKLLITGAVHGNEPCGPAAIDRAISAFRSGALRLTRGQVTFVPVMNPLAWAQNTREGMRNLNRDLCERPVPEDNEDRLGNVICPIMRAHDILIDLHSFAAEGEAFALFGQAGTGGVPEGLPEDHPEGFAHAEAELALARALGVPLLAHGWMAAHARALEQRRAIGGPAGVPAHGVGTTEYMRFTGGYAVTVECGQHLDPRAPDIALQVILNGLSHLHMIDRPLPPNPAPRVIEISEAILAEDDGDRMLRRFRAGEEVRKGEVIGTRASGAEIRAPADGALIFAGIKAEAGTELAFQCRPSTRVAPAGGQS
ncbi:L,D-transpeptidase family protein [Acidimangrovimonas sediminis]|uniref:L,D-transpeptidase family protein n=1 Tax=Acidimangrovimonas sediminis TaxID=2056283 RepID=UPI000C8101BD|nr:succinylglutamate desuccinylase/aspartoacylase family protein [Acidimangrovimonas sediminis]